MKTYKNLWNIFLSEDNIDEAIRNVCKHKTMRPKFKDLHDHPEKYKKWILHEAENYKNSKHRPLVIYDGIQRKKRTIIVPRFREQIIHHMVVNILKPIIMKSLYEHSYGSVPGRGAHLAKKYIKKAISISATNTYGAFKKRIIPYINVRKMKKRISNYDKRERRNNEISESTRNTGDEAA